MVGSAVVTAAIGPGGSTGTELPISDISSVELDLAHEVCRVHYGDSKVMEFSLVGITDITTVITGDVGSAVSFDIS